MLAPSLSKGRPLDLQLRATLEPRLGHDFSRVRVHHDEGAARAAKAQGASAYTLGADIVFGRDRYRPQSPDGLRLLSHELAHVVQQSPARRAPSSHGSATTSETRALEADADRAADAVVGRCRLPPGGLLAAPRMVQRQTAGTPPAADGEKEKAEAAHLADQKRIYGWLQGDTVWDLVREPKRDTSSLAPEEKAKDPHVIFNNSVEWLRSGRVTLSVLSRVPGQPETADPVKFFDPTVNLPTQGGSIDHTVELAANTDADTDDKGHINFVAKPGLTEERVRDTFRHEVQHVADAHREPSAVQQSEKDFQGEPGVSSTHQLLNATIWRQYETEFRGYWIGSITRPGFQAAVDMNGDPVMMGGSGGTDRWGSETSSGGELKVSGHKDLANDWPTYVPEATIPLANEKQTKIANHIVHKYFGMEETFLTSPRFRAKIQALTKPQGINLVNSLHIERLHHAIQGPATRKSVWGRTVTREEEIASAIVFLDATDRAFLKQATTAAKPFWDEARAVVSSTFFAWMEDTILRDGKNPPPAAPAAPGPQPTAPAAGAGP